MLNAANRKNEEAPCENTLSTMGLDRTAPTTQAYVEEQELITEAVLLQHGRAK